MNRYDLDGQVAVVTGGAQGIGLAVARRLHDSGARVAIWDQNMALAKEAAEALGGLAVPVDVTDLAAMQEAAAVTRDFMGPVSVLVTSAGIAGVNAKVMDTDPADWQRVLDINLNGTFHAARVILPHMVERNYGRIVAIASIAGKEGNPNLGAYSASKGAVIALVKSLGKEHARQNIAVNCVTPATAKTAILDTLTPEFIHYMLSRIPRGRFLELDEAASLIAWLCTAENSFTTGAVFDLSGGRATY
jgi:2-dehydro-3-deoxy-L-rhamnonate dehydrogenase (NAD+)